MQRSANSAKRNASEREALRQRVKKFYRRFNKADWNVCYELIDPKLTHSGKVNLDTYSKSMQSFKDAYGSVNLRWTHVNLHPEGAAKQRDKRPFAFVYVIWQDDNHGFHIFRERWIHDEGQWFTRVVGLVANAQTSSPLETEHPADS